VTVDSHQYYAKNLFAKLIENEIADKEANEALEFLN